MRNISELNLQTIKQLYDLSEAIQDTHLSLDSHKYQSRAEALEMAEAVQSELGINLQERYKEDKSFGWFNLRKSDYGNFEITFYFKGGAE